MTTALGKYFRKEKWGSSDAETVSGSGSKLTYTENLRKELPDVLKRLETKVFLDAPCGDFNWMRLVPMDGIQYIGLDIVPEIIAQNHERYAQFGRVFGVADITEHPLPMADLMQCRDCLFHLPYSYILKFLENFARSKIPYLLTTTHRLHHNKDIERPGAWRQINLLRPPFRFPEPILRIEDWVEGHPKRDMGLWSHEQVTEVAAKWRRSLEREELVKRAMTPPADLDRESA